MTSISNTTKNRCDWYEAVTRSIRVSVMTRYLPEQSSEDDRQFVWAYDVEITNEGDKTVQLRDRTWHITDANGEMEQLHGPGVVGEQPILNPGDSFRYSSGCPLTTPSGFMAGQYTMVGEDGVGFDVDIPPFSLDLPDAHKAMN